MSEMPQFPETHRRSHARLRLGIGAYLDTLEGRQKVRLLDLSQSGAQFVLSRSEPVERGVLAWLEFDSFGVVAWQDNDQVGLTFDRLLPLPWLVETRQRAPSVVREEALHTELAREWVEGKVSDNS